jgi:hypothetical protein
MWVTARRSRTIKRQPNRQTRIRNALSGVRSRVTRASLFAFRWADPPNGRTDWKLGIEVDLQQRLPAALAKIVVVAFPPIIYRIVDVRRPFAVGTYSSRCRMNGRLRCKQ